MEKIILGSKSPRRKEILSKFVDFDIKESQVSEKVNTHEEPKIVAMALAYEKAVNISKDLEKGHILICADTLVSVDGLVLGKPKSREEAKTMLKMLSGRTHSVITGLSIIETGTNKKVVDYEESHVKFRDLKDDLIDRYLDTLEYQDKAGGYGIQGIGSVLVESIEGCYFNVMGLPVYKLDILLGHNFSLNLL